MPSLPLPIIGAFGALTLALVALWAPRVSESPYAPLFWTLPCAVAAALGLGGGLIDARGLLGLLFFAVACAAAKRARGSPMAIATHMLMFAACASLFLHVVPGVSNPPLVTDVVLGPGSTPYTKYLNFDKGMAGLLLLGLYAADQAAADQGARHLAAFLWRFVVVTAVVMGLSLALGYLWWDPKLPPWWPAWTWSMVFLTALPEEALFRGVVQPLIARRLASTDRGTTAAIVIAAVLFGIAHLAGGPVPVAFASAAGLGYGWIYASTHSIGAAVAAHAGLNAIHFLFFSYPALG
ncbi:MAG: CPBP family intramembrane glutamic endopeptidase [Acidobacteriota bacterium]